MTLNDGRTHILHVLTYNTEERFHLCRDYRGGMHRVDLMVDGGFPDSKPEDLVGKTVECESMHAYVAIAQGVRIVEKEPKHD